MNPLTLVKRIQNINSREAALGISEDASWHAKYKESAYVFVGGIPFDLTEGDLLAVFAQYGEIVDVNLVRDKGTGKSKGFAFVAYEDQRSTNLAVDNLNGAQILGRIIRVDHVSNYKKKEEEDEETERQKREARGVCRAFQRGECNRGAGCKFSHDEQRASNTGWGSEDRSSRWGHDKFQGPTKIDGRPNSLPTNGDHDPTVREGHRLGNKDARNSRTTGIDEGRKSHHRRGEWGPRDQDDRGPQRQMEQKKELNYREDLDRRANERRSGRHDQNPSEDHDRRREDQDSRATERRSRRHDFESKSREGDRKEEERDWQATERRSRKPEFESKARDDSYMREEKRSRRHELELKPNDHGRREEKESRRHESESDLREDHRDERANKWSGHSKDTASHRHNRER